MADTSPGKSGLDVHVWIEPCLRGSPEGSVLIKKETFTLLHSPSSTESSPTAETEAAPTQEDPTTKRKGSGLRGVEESVLRELIRAKYDVRDDSLLEIVTSDPNGRPSPSSSSKSRPATNHPRRESSAADSVAVIIRRGR